MTVRYSAGAGRLPISNPIHSKPQLTMKKNSIFTKLRFYTALSSVMLLNLNIFGLSLRSFCSPGFNCHGCPLATFACPIGVMTFGSAVRQLPLMAVAFVLAVGALSGRFICGFFCPFGWFQDMLYKIPGAKITLPRFMNWFKYAFLLFFVFLLPFLFGFEQSGYVALPDTVINKGLYGDVDLTVLVQNKSEKTVKAPAVDVVYLDKETKEEIYRKKHNFPEIIIAPGKKLELPPIKAPNKLAVADILISSPQSKVNQTPKYDLYFCRICPNGSLTASLPAHLTKNSEEENIYSASSWFSLRFIILYIFIILMILSSRPFCRTMCPLGAIYGLTTRLSLARFEFNEETCIDCGLCDKICPVNLDVRKEIGKMECIACGDCIRKCPKNCLSRNFLGNNKSQFQNYGQPHSE